jgi:hypothetical protein
VVTDNMIAPPFRVIGAASTGALREPNTTGRARKTNRKTRARADAGDRQR